MELSDAERLIKVETKVDNIENVILRLEKLLLLREECYVTKDIIQIELKLRDERIDGLQRTVNDMKDNQKTSKQSYPAWSQVFLGAATILVAIIALIK